MRSRGGMETVHALVDRGRRDGEKKKEEGEGG